MNFNIGGLIVKNNFTAWENQVLDKIYGEKLLYLKELDFENVFSVNFDSIGIFQYKGILWIIDNNLPFSCSFSKELTRFDKELKLLSMHFGIICFFIHSFSNSYGISHFEGGSRIFCSNNSEGLEVFHEFKNHDFQINSTSKVIEYLESFTEINLLELYDIKESIIKCYRQQ